MMIGFFSNDRTNSIPVISGILISINSRSIVPCFRYSAPDMASSNVRISCSSGNWGTYLARYVHQFPELQLIRTVEDAISGAEDLKQGTTPLHFNDINVPSITGIVLCR